LPVPDHEKVNRELLEELSKAMLSPIRVVAEQAYSLCPMTS
jgi:hypothetical protein